MVLSTLHKVKLLTNLKKYSFMKRGMIYLGFVVSEEGLKMRNAFEVRIFHELASFYRNFIRILSQICAPSVETIKERKQRFKWTETNNRNFKLLKKKTTEKFVLALPSFDKLFQFETDASGTTIRVVLSQEQRPIAYFSKKLNEEK
jgi:hypothetical protein